jgi:threonine/homoserine/homoserine lactone efflux protein
VGNITLAQPAAYNITPAARACGLSKPAARSAYLRVKAWADRIAAGGMAALGLRLLIER